MHIFIFKYCLRRKFRVIWQMVTRNVIVLVKKKVLKILSELNLKFALSFVLNRLLAIYVNTFSNRLSVIKVSEK